MNPDQVLARERTEKPRAVTAAVLAAILTLGGSIVLSLVGRDLPSNSPGVLVFFNDHAVGEIGGTAVRCLGYLAMAAVLVLLFGWVKARRPEIPRIGRFMALFGGIGVALTQLAQTVAIVVQSGSFVSSGGQTWRDADDILSGGAVQALAVVGLGATLALAVAFVLVSLNALRAGLLTRFMGYLGVFVGVLFVLPLGSPLPIVQTFWLLTLAYLFSGRWPNGVPPAWKTGKAEPWPTMQQQREEQAKARGETLPPPAASRPGGLLGGLFGGGAGGAGRGGGGLFGGGARQRSAPEPEPSVEPEPEPAGTPHPSSKKRKRKRRA